MVRGRPSGLKAACGTAARRPDLDPGDHCGPWRQDPRARLKPAPALRAAPRLRPALGRVNAEGAIYRDRCNDPLSPRCVVDTLPEHCLRRRRWATPLVVAVFRI